MTKLEIKQANAILHDINTRGFAKVADIDSSIQLVKRVTGKELELNSNGFLIFKK